MMHIAFLESNGESVSGLLPRFTYTHCSDLSFMKFIIMRILYYQHILILELQEFERSVFGGMQPFVYHESSPQSKLRLALKRLRSSGGAATSLCLLAG
jgi:hypothetical protein